MKRFFENLDLEVTPIVAYGLVALSLIMGGLGLSRLSGAVTGVAARAEAAQAELSSLSTIQGDDVWGARLAQSEALRKRIEDKVLTGTTGGVVAADFQKSLRKAARLAQIDNLKIRVNPEVDTIEDVQIVQFTFSGSASDWYSVIDFLSEMLARESAMIVSDLSFAKGQRSGIARVSMAGLIPVKIQAAPPNKPSVEAQP